MGPDVDRARRAGVMRLCSESYMVLAVKEAAATKKLQSRTNHLDAPRVRQNPLYFPRTLLYTTASNASTDIAMAVKRKTDSGTATAPHKKSRTGMSFLHPLTSLFRTNCAQFLGQLPQI